MKVVDVLPFRFGTAASRPLAPEELEFYCELARRVCATTCTLATGKTHRTISVRTKAVNIHPTDVFGLIVERVGARDRATSILVIDLATREDQNLRGVIDLYCASALNAVLLGHQRNGREKPLTIILLFATLPPQDDACAQMLLDHLDNGRLIIIANDGTCLPATAPSPEFNAKEYRLAIAHIRGEPLGLLRLKMVRRLGHFQRFRGGRHTRCVRYFYDGRFCVNEIAQLLCQFVDTLPNKPILVHDDLFADWLADASYSAATSLNTSVLSVQTLISLSREALKRIGDAPLLLLEPLIDTGATLQANFASLSSALPRARISVFAVLSTHGDLDTRGKRSLLLGATRVRIPYLLRVEQATFSPGHDSCEMCRLDIPRTAESAEPYLQLTSFDFWSMVNDAGVKPETEVPRYRKGLAYVPDFARMVDQNGPWLTGKLMDLIDYVRPGLLTESIVVSPAEPGSEVMTKYLDVLTEATVIAIPRDVIEEFDEDKADFAALSEEWEQEEPKWFVQLSTAPPMECAIADEFTVSGRTIDALKTLLRHFNMDVTCSTVLANLGPEESQHQTDTYALYEWRVHRAM